MKRVLDPRKRAWHMLAALLILGALLSASTRSAPAQAATPTQAATAAPTGTDISCDTTPFGRVLALGKENEVFLGYNYIEQPFPNTPGSYLFDWNPIAGVLRTRGLALGTGIAPSPVASWAAAAADLDGDGKAEFIQGFTDANGQYQIVVNNTGGPVQGHTENWPGHTYRAMASGDILGRGNGAQQLVVASRGGDGGLTIAVFAGAAGGNVGSPVALWRNNDPQRMRSQPTLIQVAVGNLDNDPYADIIVAFLQSDRRTAQLIYLEYQANYQVGSGSNMALNLQERASSTYMLGVTPQALRMALADLNGDVQDTVVLAWDEVGGLGGRSPLLWVRDFDFQIINGTAQFVNRELWTTTSNAVNFAVAAGDVDGNHRDEIIVGYDTDDSQRGNLNFVTLSLINQDTPTPELSQIHRWQGGFGYVGLYLGLAVGDLNKDNRADVVAAFKDTNGTGFRTVVLNEKFDTTNTRPLGLQLLDTRRQDSTLTGPINLVMGDWDNDSIKAFVKGRCARVVDAHVTAANFVPPYWQVIQGGQQKGGWIGQSTSQGATVERSFTYSRSETVSAYIGAGIGASFFDIAEFSAAARATGSREYAISDRKVTSTGKTVVTTVGQSWSDDALVYEPAEYKCFSYQIAVNNVFVPTDDARLRFCEYQRRNSRIDLQASELNSWDDNFARKPEYTPVIRDWSSLALFRGAFTDQSSNAATARLAVDSEIVDGSYAGANTAQTAVENNPWWQVDLGSVQEIDKVRLWTPKASLSNFYVFVSDTDFRTIAGHGDPRNLLKHPGVRHYSLADLGNGLAITDTAGLVSTFLTLDAKHDPIQGRYVRVQRVGTGQLSLAEVQVFGANHIDPDRYPLDLQDTTKNDGWFEVRLYNPYHTSDDDMYAWVKTRGNLLWNGGDNESLTGLSVDRGNGTKNWALSTHTETSKVQAQEIVNNTSVGAEFEVEGGVGIKVQTGGGVERTTGIASEVVQSTSWGNSFDMGGSLQGFPTKFDDPENEWVLKCRYYYQPYYYELSETSNLGYQHHFPVLDYLVPDAGHAADLDRAIDLSACRNGNQPGDTLQVHNDTAQTNPGVLVVLDVLANDVGTDLQITSVSVPRHGAATHTDRTVTYTPAPGFRGTDTFTYTASGGAAAGTATGIVSVVVGNDPGGTTTIVYLPVVRR